MTRPQLGRPVGASGEETRMRIIFAAMKCVAEVGYARATIREIARTAKVTSASLYNYFPNKAELIKATIAARAEFAMPLLRKAAEGPGDIVGRIEAVLDECGRLVRRYPDLAAFEWAIRADQGMILDAPDTVGRLGPESGFTTFRQLIEGLVDDANRAGELGTGTDPQGVVEVIYALIFGLTELAATLPPEEYTAALDAAKVMVRGALFEAA
ncbi:TetR/AcrR family transcriptional regulator [Mycobacterium bourgelatii]|uniref:TetR family transcriptional regulator n=1 Tax=Mycobacterium bourgelatii TaxID=1273442 RepID=A0A7I9YZ84_MYCBU|nr:TetR/AcrR family transcriptional regulator [Mycobacterium bourgelatii]MCV6976470.1 TetR/AcrR family transcriptional regulator [Mycobacterium bourgelatii]GFG93918.1 TetR family transcriptional regulator [Mycobacterium bourgelatii]